MHVHPIGRLVVLVALTVSLPSAAAPKLSADEMRKALAALDDGEPRTIADAQEAATAAGAAKQAEVLPELIAVAQKPFAKVHLGAQIAAIRAIGEIGTIADKREKAAAALIEVVQRQRPAPGATEDERAAYLAPVGAAVNALAAVRSPTAMRALMFALYRDPELMNQIRRALVALGPAVDGELRKVIRGEHAGVNDLVKKEKLDKYCGDHGERAPKCDPVAWREFATAIVIGDRHVEAAVPDLVAALGKPPLPAYMTDDSPGPLQQTAIFDALRKIGSPSAAAAVRAAWQNAKLDTQVRIAAIAAYPFVVRDTTGVAELGKIAADNGAADELRIEAATAYGRLATAKADLPMLDEMVLKYLDAADKKKKEAEPKRADAEAADRDLDRERKALDDMKAKLLATTKDQSKTAADIKAELAKVKEAEDKFKAFKKANRERTASFRQVDAAAKAYVGYARMFQLHIARVEIAMRCKADLPCYAASLTARPDEVAKAVAPYIKDVASWSADDRASLVAVQIDRAMLELGKRRTTASGFADAMLDAAGKTEDRFARSAILLALPLVAKLPCPSCVTKLDALLRASEGKTNLAPLTTDTQVVRNYFDAAK